ncbi:DoxX family protein [Myxococcaceae bacterium GXIMD 01537]
MSVLTLSEQPDVLRAAALVPARLSLGATMVVHGLAKLRKEGQEQNVAFFEGIGFKPGKPWVVATGLTEFLAGVSAILGVGTRLTALGVLATQAVAIAKVHAPKGFEATKGGYEFNLALCAMALGLLVRGPDRLSVHGALERSARRKVRRGLRLLRRRHYESRLLDALA